VQNFADIRGITELIENPFLTCSNIKAKIREKCNLFSEFVPNLSFSGSYFLTGA